MPAPAGKSEYPGPADLAMFLAPAGVSIPPTADLTTAAAAGVREFERAAERTMLAPAVDATRRLNAPVSREGKLVLDHDLAALTSVVFQPTGSTNTTALTEGKEFTIEPWNAPADGHPYTTLVFGPWGWDWQDPLHWWYRGAFSVTGQWGYATTLPEDVWQAMLARAAAFLWPSLTAGHPGGAGGLQSEARSEGEKGGGGSITRTYRDLGGLAPAWQSSFDATARRYRRYTI